MQPNNTSMRMMTREEVRAVDAWAINDMGVPGVVLMENAGRACADLIRQRIDAIERPRVGILCGPGNNGGDGYVIARHLLNEDIDVTVFLCGMRDKVRGDAAVNLAILEKQGQAIRLLDVNTIPEGTPLQALLGPLDLMVDAIFGTGLHGPLSEAWIRFIDALNALGVPIVAVDIPSGLDCDSGLPLGAAVKAADTVTFVAQKQGFTAAHAHAYTGRVTVASIGIRPKE